MKQLTDLEFERHFQVQNGSEDLEFLYIPRLDPLADLIQENVLNTSPDSKEKFARDLMNLFLTDGAWYAYGNTPIRLLTPVPTDLVPQEVLDLASARVVRRLRYFSSNEVVHHKVDFLFKTIVEPNIYVVHPELPFRDNVRYRLMSGSVSFLMSDLLECFQGHPDSIFTEEACWTTTTFPEDITIFLSLGTSAGSTTPDQLKIIFHQDGELHVNIRTYPVQVSEDTPDDTYQLSYTELQALGSMPISNEGLPPGKYNQRTFENVGIGSLEDLDLTASWGLINIDRHGDPFHAHFFPDDLRHAPVFQLNRSL